MPPQLGFSPFPYYITPQGLRPDLAPPLDQILHEIAAAGYKGVPAEVPAGMTPAAYMARLADNGLAPAPGYFQADFADTDTIDGVLQAAAQAAAEHAELGLNRIFVAQQFPNAERFARPAQGFASDPSRLDRIVKHLDAAAKVMVALGVMPCLHPHVSTSIETPDEACFVLDAIPADRLMFGPDLGHLAWAGADPVEMLMRYRDRLGAVHLKDMRAGVAVRARTDGMDYRQATWGGLWAVPGSGDIDYESAMAVLRGLDIWVIAEIDIPEDDGPNGAAHRAFQWLAPRLADLV